MGLFEVDILMSGYLIYKSRNFMGLFELRKKILASLSTKVEILWVYLSQKKHNNIFIYKSRNFMGLFEI